MKRLLFLISLSFISGHSFSQTLDLKGFSLVGGKNYTTFLFHDSEGNKDKTLDVVSLHSFGINASLTKGKSTLRPELLFRQAGAKSDANGLPLSWKMNYIDLNVGYLFSLLTSERFAISPGLAVGCGYMLNGEQYIGDMRYSLIDTKALSRFDFTAQAMSNFKLQLSEAINLSLEYRVGLGINQIEKDLTAQKTRNVFQSALLGIGYSIH
jgi:hypothetical protein